MPLQASCTRCGRPVRWVDVDGEQVALDPTPSHDGRFRLVAEDGGRAELIDRPGHQGYQAHDETCPRA
jgi:hypothetical protein